MKARSLCEIIQSYNPNQIIRKTSRLLDELECAQLGFHWLHGANLSMSIGELGRIIQTYKIKAPRTGHLGNWQEIWAGRAGALDHNGTVCKSKLAFPYIFDLNQTENHDLTSGDTVYLVGSMINGMHRSELSLYTWDGHQFSKRTRENSYFVPFVLVKSDSGLIPLSTLQKQSCLMDSSVQFNSDKLVLNESKVREIIRALITSCCDAPNKNISMDDLFDRKVYLNGTMSRTSSHIEGGVIHIGTQRYNSIDKFLDAWFLPIKAASKPRIFFENPDKWETAMPFASLPLLYSLDYLLANPEDKFNVSFEWGAFGSAAYPPHSKGYFKEKAKTIKKIVEVIIRIFPEQKATFCLLLPSAIFNLLPCNIAPQDAIAVNDMFEEIINETANINADNTKLLVSTIDNITQNWWQSHKNTVSSYYRARFIRRRSVHHKSAMHSHAEPVFLPSFNQLTLQQASMIVGGLFKVAKSTSEESYALTS